MSEADVLSPPPSYEDLVPTVEQYEIYYIYDVALFRNYLSPFNLDNGSNTTTSISLPPTIILDLSSPPDYCELPPPYSIEDSPPQLELAQPVGSRPPVGLRPPVDPPSSVVSHPPVCPPPPVGPQPPVDPPPPVDYPPLVEPPPPYVGDSGQQVRSQPPNIGNSTQQINEILFHPLPNSCMTYSVINFIICPLYGIVPLVFSLMIQKGDVITARKYSSTVIWLNLLAASLNVCLYLALCCIMVPILVGKNSASSSGSSASSTSVSWSFSCC